MNVPVIIPKSFTKQDAWHPLKKFTNARIAIGRTGTAIPLAETLQFRADHANARDAVYATLDSEKLGTEAGLFNIPVMHLQSSAANRIEYLQRPDRGRQLNTGSKTKLAGSPPCDIAVVIADGLSAHAVEQHAVPVLKELFYLWANKNFSISPICVVQQGRVAIGDEIGMLLKAKLSVVLIGERPGLSSPHSMGIYITYQPVTGLTDESRNCISNIHPLGGLSYSIAASQAFNLIQSAFASQLSGVLLKKGHHLNA